MLCMQAIHMVVGSPWINRILNREETQLSLWCDQHPTLFSVVKKQCLKTPSHPLLCSLGPVALGRAWAKPSARGFAPSRVGPKVLLGLCHWILMISPLAGLLPVTGLAMKWVFPVSLIPCASRYTTSLHCAGVMAAMTRWSCCAFLHALGT